MKPNLNTSDAPKHPAFLSKLNIILTSLNLDNFKYRIIQGETDTVANTQRLFKHGMVPRPWLCVPLDGDVWFGPISNENIDVRSTQSGMNFRVLVLG